jgi:hypothetical protein
LQHSFSMDRKSSKNVGQIVDFYENNCSFGKADH